MMRQIKNWAWAVWRFFTDWAYVPAPLQVLPPTVRVWDKDFLYVATGPTSGTVTVDNGSVRTVLPYNASAEEFGAAVSAEPDPMVRTLALLTEQRRVLNQLLYGPWELPEDPFNPDDWESLIAKAEDPYRWTPDIDWESPIAEGRAA